jgi:hypothetical protein
MRIPLLASCTLALAGCFVGIDTSLMDRDAGGSHPDGGSPVDGATADLGAPDDASPDGSDSSLVGYWSFDHASGTTVPDDSGHGHGAALLEPLSFAAGVSGQALVMNGTQRMDVSSLEGSAFPVIGTLSLWFQFPLSNINGPQKWGIFDVHDIASGRPHFSLQQLPNGQEEIDIDFTSNLGQPAVNDCFASTSDVWNHVVVTWDVGRYAVYWATQGNALKSVSSGAYTYAFSPTGQQFRVGTAYYGAIDEVRLYSRPFSSSEVGGIP